MEGRDQRAHDGQRGSERRDDDRVEEVGERAYRSWREGVEQHLGEVADDAENLEEDVVRAAEETADGSGVFTRLAGQVVDDACEVIDRADALARGAAAAG